jgi:hypothetical protein
MGDRAFRRESEIQLREERMLNNLATLGFV